LDGLGLFKRAIAQELAETTDISAFCARPGTQGSG
jgi:hypothetical protein